MNFHDIIDLKHPEKAVEKTTWLKEINNTKDVIFEPKRNSSRVASLEQGPVGVGREYFLFIFIKKN